jgi:hypothetical protein
MLNVGKIIGMVLTILFLSTISFAATCASGDCELDKKKLQLLDKMSVKPTTTKDQATPEVEKPKIVPFQIPRPVSSQTQPTQQTQDNKEESDDQSQQLEQPKINPGLKGFMPPSPDSKATTNNLKQQESEVKTQPQSGIIYR